MILKVINDSLKNNNLLKNSTLCRKITSVLVLV